MKTGGQNTLIESARFFIDRSVIRFLIGYV